MIEIVEFCAGWLKIKCPERYTYEITFTRLDGQPDEIQQHTSEELARDCFRLFDEPDSAEMYSKIELGGTYHTGHPVLGAFLCFAGNGRGAIICQAKDIIGTGAVEMGKLDQHLGGDIPLAGLVIGIADLCTF